MVTALAPTRHLATLSNRAVSGIPSGDHDHSLRVVDNLHLVGAYVPIWAGVTPRLLFESFGV